MSLERRVSFPDRPELNSPYFSYKVSNPEKTGEILRLLRNKDEPFSIQIGEEGHGFFSPLTIGFHNSIRDGFSYDGITLSTHFSLPSDYYKNFIETPGLIPLRSPEAIRGLSLQNQLKKYVDKDLTLLHGWGEGILRKKGQTKTVACLPGDERGIFIHYMPDLIIPNDNSPERVFY